MNVSRRAFLGTTVAGVGGGLAGCLGSDSIELEGDDVLPVPVLGDSDADVTVMVFEDFTCPACAQFKRQVHPQLVGQYADPGHIRYEHRDLPIPVDEQWAYAVASAARSVHDQAGDEAFFAYAGEIYGYQNAGYSLDAIETAAADLPVDVDAEAVRADAEDEAYREELEAEAERGADAGVEGTPTVVVNGAEVEPSLSGVTEAIDDELDE